MGGRNGARIRRAPGTGILLRALSLAVIVAVTGCSPPGASPSDSQSGAPPSAPSNRHAPPRTAPAESDPVAEYVDHRLAAMTLRQKIGSLLMLHHPGTDATPLRALAERHDLGGLIMMSDNVPPTVDALRALTDAVSPDPGLPLLLGIDQEGGVVSRLPFDSSPGAGTLRTLPAAATHDAFLGRSVMLKEAGISVNFGIVADVTGDPGSFIFSRVLGTDTASASARVAAAVTGEGDRVVSTLKHFPGHGAAPGDSHTSIPVAGLRYPDWLLHVAPPFQAGIDAGAGMVMYGHLAYPAVDPLPASLSKRWHEILRRDLGFRGITITDDMLMLQHTGLPEYADAGENAIAALEAGNTMLLYVLPANPALVGVDIELLVARIAQAVEVGRLPVNLIDDNVRQLMTLRRSVSGQSG